MTESKRSWLSGGPGTFKTFSKQTHDEARAAMRAIESRKYERPYTYDVAELQKKVEEVKAETVGIESAQASKERYWKERETRQNEFFSKNPSASHADFARAEKPFSDAAKKQSGAAGRTLEQTIGRAERHEDKPVETGARGGRFYVAATGAKVYVKSNPGAETVGHMRNQTFHQGLPMSVHLAEPRRR